MTTKHVSVLASAVLLSGCATTGGDHMGRSAPVAYEVQDSEGAATPSQESSGEPALDELAEGYPAEDRQVGGPTDVDADLAASFPQPDSVMGGRPPQAYFDWKQRIYEEHGLKLGFSYQSVIQKASDIGTNLPLPGTGEDIAAGGWMLFEVKWDAYNRGQDWQGGFVAALDWRTGFGNAAIPSMWQTDTGSLWATEFTILEWDPWLPVLYWEQWAQKDRFVARVGGQNALQMFDFFRFKDGRTSFTSSQFTTPAATIPFPAPGLGAAFEMWPVESSPLYVVGTVNDMNAVPGEISWDNAFEYGQFFYGLEVGYNWRRSPTDFDHVHLGVFYADERDTQEPFFPNAAGGGFKLAGSKQWDRIVAFGNYTFNTAEGGYFGTTLARQALNAGVAYLRPAGIRGEVALGTTWAQPTQDFENAPAFWNGGRDQYGFETYWKILLTPDLWITPGVQGIFDPTFAQDTDFLAIATFKFRLVL